MIYLFYWCQCHFIIQIALSLSSLSVLLLQKKIEVLFTVGVRLLMVFYSPAWVTSTLTSLFAAKQRERKLRQIWRIQELHLQVFSSFHICVNISTRKWPYLPFHLKGSRTYCMQLSIVYFIFSAVSAANTFSFSLEGQGMSEGKKPLYHCNYCNKDISGKIRIKCVVCPDFDLCIECFSVGAEVKPHRSNHPYRVMVSTQFLFVLPPISLS